MTEEKCSVHEEVIDGVMHTTRKYDLNNDTFRCKLCATSKYENPDIVMFMDINMGCTCKTCMDSQLQEYERSRLENSPIETELIRRGLNDGGIFALLPLDKDDQVVTFDHPLVFNYALLFGGTQLTEYPDIDVALSALLDAANRYKNDLQFAQEMDDKYIHQPRTRMEAYFSSMLITEKTR